MAKKLPMPNQQAINYRGPAPSRPVEQMTQQMAGLPADLAAARAAGAAAVAPQKWPAGSKPGPKPPGTTTVADDFAETAAMTGGVSPLPAEDRGPSDPTLAPRVNSGVIRTRSGSGSAVFAAVQEGVQSDGQAPPTARP